MKTDSFSQTSQLKIQINREVYTIKLFNMKQEKVRFMLYPPLIEGQLIKRYKRFFADIELKSGEVVTAHCVNTGSMKGLISPKAKVLISEATNPKRKLKYTLEAIFVDKALVGINTHLTNTLAHDAIQNGVIKKLIGYPIINKEVKYGDSSRLDFMLENNAHKCYVEVKNVSLVEDQVAMFPDSVSARGTKHLEELIKIKKEGHRSVMLFVSQRNDPISFEPAWGIDPIYSKTLNLAQKEGVEILVYKCHITPTKNEIQTEIPWSIIEKK